MAVRVHHNRCECSEPAHHGSHAAWLLGIDGQAEVLTLLVILIGPMIAERVLRATRALPRRPRTENFPGWSGWPRDEVLAPAPVPQVALRPLNPAGGPLPERRPQPTTAKNTANTMGEGNHGIMEKLTITTPSDLLSLIGHTLGFWPQESLVCITLNENSIGATLRIDLPRQPGQELP